MDITQVLANAASPDAATRANAEQQIDAAKTQNLPLLMLQLANTLAADAAPEPTRQAAGLVLKNALHAKDPKRKLALATTWLHTDPAAKLQIKKTVLSALAAGSKVARHTAAMAISAMATIDLPQNQWPDLIEGLVKNVTGGSSGADAAAADGGGGAGGTGAASPHLTQSSLEALGYICEEIEPEVLEAQANLILTAVVQGMRKENPVEIRKAGTDALLNALDFVKTNFDNEAERNYIMQTVCETTQAESDELRCAAFECAVRVAELYYDKLPTYMNALYMITTAVITKATHDEAEEEVAQQAIELWSTLCEEEIDLQEEADDNAGATPERTNHRFVAGASPTLVPLLLEALCRQSDDTEDDWNVAVASATCLANVARCVGDDIVGLVFPFIEQHIRSADWHRREAASNAFGSILEGPSEATLGRFMPQAIDLMIGHMRDPVVHVKDTAAWAIGRICELHIRAISQPQWVAMTKPLAPGESAEAEGVLLAGLKDAPRVANNVCVALHNLAEHCEATRDEPTNVLSPLFIPLAQALLACTERPDATESNLRCAAYEALNTTLINSAEDTKPHIEQLLPVINQRLERTFALQIVSNDDREQQSELQGLLCGSLQMVTQKLGERARPYADQMMHLFLQVFGGKNSTVHEEALMAVGSVANATEADFEKYMPHFRPFLALGLNNCEEHQVCSVAVGVVGDIARALEAKMLPYCDEIVDLLLRNLQNPDLARSVKPPILSCFGDIALAIGGHFEKYLSVTMTMLLQASRTEVGALEANSAHMEAYVEYIGQLREGILEAYTGVLQGLRADDKGSAFGPYVQGVLELLVRLSIESQQNGAKMDDELLRAAVGVVGDLAMTLDAQFKQLVRQPQYKDHIVHLLKDAAGHRRSQGTQEVAGWAQSITFS